MTPGVGMTAPALKPSRTASNPLAANHWASSSSKPYPAGVNRFLSTKLVPFNMSTRPSAVVSQRPWWPIGPNDAGCTSGVAVSGVAAGTVEGVL